MYIKNEKKSIRSVLQNLQAQNFKNRIIICQPDVTRCQHHKHTATDVPKGVHHDKFGQSVPSPIKAILVAY